MQLREIRRILAPNATYKTFKKKYQKKDVLDLERYLLNAEAIKDLAFYISINTPFFFFESSRIKQIKAPVLTNDLTDEDVEPLIEALKKNNRITTLTMDYRQISPETEQKIRIQLMFNKAIQKMRPNLGILNYVTTGLTAASILTAILPALSSTLVFLGAMVSRFVYNTYFFYQLQQAKFSDFSQPENMQVIEREKNPTDSWLAYLNPRTYTPMAYMGYTIEKEKLISKYDVNTDCFKSNLRRRIS